MDSQALPAIKRGVLWQQRERLWSRWKERYFILTSDYLHCFKRRAAGDGLSQMGHFIFKVTTLFLDWVSAGIIAGDLKLRAARPENKRVAAACATVHMHRTFRKRGIQAQRDADAQGGREGSGQRRLWRNGAPCR